MRNINPVDIVTGTSMGCITYFYFYLNLGYEF